MKRRSFLKGLAIAPAAAPVAAQEAIAEFSQLSTGRTALHGGGMLGGGIEYASPEGPRSDWRMERLKKFLSQSAEQIAFERKTFGVHGLEPEVAGMHSVSMPNKIRLSRDRQFDRIRRNEHEHLLGGIAGWFD